MYNYEVKLTITKHRCHTKLPSIQQYLEHLCYYYNIESDDQITYGFARLPRTNLEDIVSMLLDNLIQFDVEVLNVYSKYE